VQMPIFTEVFGVLRVSVEVLGSGELLGRGRSRLFRRFLCE
jgi:hypothetical protein